MDFPFVIFYKQTTNAMIKHLFDCVFQRSVSLRDNQVGSISLSLRNYFETRAFSPFPQWRQWHDATSQSQSSGAHHSWNDGAAPNRYEELKRQQAIYFIRQYALVEPGKQAKSSILAETVLFGLIVESKRIPIHCLPNVSHECSLFKLETFLIAARIHSVMWRTTWQTATIPHSVRKINVGEIPSNQLKFSI